MPQLQPSAFLPVICLLALATFACVAAEGIPSGAPSTVVATQGDAIVTLVDIDAFADRMPETQRAAFFNSPSRIEGVVTNLLLQKQLASQARASGLDKDPVVQRDVEMAREDALGKARVERFKAELKLPDFSELAQEDYIANKSKYVNPGMLVVKHVLIATKNRSEDQAKAIAETVVAEAKAHPDQFDALIDKYSDDPSKKVNKGVMENAGDASKYVPEFATASSALKKPGDVSAPVKTAYGFHVIKLIERTSDKPSSFADVKDQIVARLRSEYVEKQVRAFTDTLRNLPVDANPGLVASLRTRYGEVQKSQMQGVAGGQ